MADESDDMGHMAESADCGDVTDSEENNDWEKPILEAAFLLGHCMESLTNIFTINLLPYEP